MSAKKRWTPAALWFTQEAYAKMAQARDAHDVEVGFLGLTDPEDPTYVLDLFCPKQKNTPCTVEFDADWLAEFQEEMIGKGIYPDRFLRVWIHTHPGTSAHPSGTDLKTFEEQFGGCEMAFMVIFGKGQGAEAFCRVRLSTAESFIEKDIPIKVSQYPLPAAWLEEVKSRVTVTPFAQQGGFAYGTGTVWSPAQSNASNGATPASGTAATSVDKAVRSSRLDMLRQIGLELVQADFLKDDECYAVAYGVYDELSHGEQSWLDRWMRGQHNAMVTVEGLMSLTD